MSKGKHIRSTYKEQFSGKNVVPETDIKPKAASGKAAFNQIKKWIK